MPPSAARLTSGFARRREVTRGVTNHPSINGMQGVRGSNPLSSTPGQRPSPPSTARESRPSRSRYAAICSARPIRSSGTAVTRPSIVGVLAPGRPRAHRAAGGPVVRDEGPDRPGTARSITDWPSDHILKGESPVSCDSHPSWRLPAIGVLSGTCGLGGDRARGAITQLRGARDLSVVNRPGPCAPASCGMRMARARIGRC
jgi:hypothetical protein